MRDSLPTREVQEILCKKSFLRLYGQDRFVYVSDAPRRVASDTLVNMQKTMRDRGFSVEVSSSNLLLIDLQPFRWRMLLSEFPHFKAESIPHSDPMIDVYALARLLFLHPSAFEQQPMEPIRAVLKRYTQIDRLPALAAQLLTQCAQRLRLNQPLPSALADVLYTWLKEQKEEERA